jgi:hypothetical protein
MKSRIVEVEHPRYGLTKLDVAHVIALIPDKFEIVFEMTVWPLNVEDYKKVEKVWTDYTENIICDVP